MTSRLACICSKIRTINPCSIFFHSFISFSFSCSPFSFCLFIFLMWNRIHEFLDKTKFVDTRDTSLEYYFKDITTSILLPCTYLPRNSSSFTITLYSDKYVNLEDIEHRKAYPINDCWKGEESKRHTSTFSLICTEEGNVDILLVPKVPPPAKEERDITLIITVNEKIEDRFSRLLHETFEGRSMCISVHLKKGVKYLIEADATNLPSQETYFKLIAYSNHIGEFQKSYFSQ